MNKKYKCCRTSIIYALWMSFVFMPGVAMGDAVIEAINQRMEDLLFTGDLKIRDIPIAADGVLPAFYASREFRPAWNDESQADELLRLLEGSADQGLRTEDYFPDMLRALLEERRRTASDFVTADLDILLTESLVRYGYHQRFGKVKANSIDTRINFRRALVPNRDSTQTIQSVIDSSSLAGKIDELIPRGPIFNAVQRHLVEYQSIEEAGGWNTVPEGPTLRPGDRDARISAIRQRLAVTGDLPATSDLTSSFFDETLEQAVVAFQSRHALDPDGVAGQQTLNAMNVPVEVRIDQLRLVLERVRWLSQEITNKYVVVNIAGFRLYMVRGREVVWSSRVQVGKAYRQTPVFRGDIRYLELNPTWTVPPGILAKDVLPAIQKDPNYLAKKNMSVIDRDGQIVDPVSVDWNRYKRSAPFVFRQEPGPNNALGRIKFIWPNEHFVFMHDTPSRRLFDRSERTFSSGCIRVEDPLTLAELVLDQPSEWTVETLETEISTAKTRRVYLEKTVPVLVTYLTATPDSEGRMHFFKDVYDRDDKLLRALDAKVTIDVPAR